MGWWKCNDNGGIDWNDKPSGASETTLINAIPDRDTTEDHYNGDAPADAMVVPTAIIKSWLADRNPKPDCDQIVKMLTEDVIEDVFSHIPISEIQKLKKHLWKEIDEIYIEAWNRPSYEEERVLICRFVFGWTNRNSKNKKDWKMNSRERQMVADYDTGKFPYWWRTA